MTRWELEAWSARESVKVCIGAHHIPMQRARQILDGGFSKVRIYKVTDDIRTLVRIVDRQPAPKAKPWWHQGA